MRSRILLAILLCAPAGFADDSPLQAVYRRMDAGAATFKGFTADLVKIDHQNFVDSNDKGSGSIAVRKSGPHSVQVLEKIVTLNGSPDGEQMELNGTHFTIFHPKINTATEYDLGKKYHGVLEAVMLMGLGGTSKDLQQAYKVAFGGADTVNGQPASRLVLNPYEQQLAQLYPKIEVWISDATGLAVQQKLYEKGEADYHIQTYTNVKPGAVSEAQVRLDLPKNVIKEHPR
jgi:outer membrane lipoprotein-sorting protein